jgi:hypothetical protein
MTWSRDNKIEFWVASQDQEGNICLGTGFNLSNTDYLNQMIKEKDSQYDDLSFINSLDEFFGK